MQYKLARDAAWKILINNKVSELPVNLEKICRNEKINLFTFSAGRHFIETLDLSEHTVDNDAFSVGSVIFYDETKPETRKRFSIAHELGHIFLHAQAVPHKALYFRESRAASDPLELEANIFASRLLAPLCVLQFLNVNSARQISELCNIGYTAARLRFSRLCAVRKRNAELRREGNRGTFLLSRYERKVLENFEAFIRLNKLP